MIVNFAIENNHLSVNHLDLATKEMGHEQCYSVHGNMRIGYLSRSSA